MKRILGLVTVALGLALLTGCSSSAPPVRDNQVELFVTVHPDGSASADLFLNGLAGTEAERVGLGDQVGQRLFPTSTSRTAQPNGDGVRTSSLAITAGGVFQPGPQPTVSMNTQEATRWLLDHGAESVALFVTAPTVKVDAVWAPLPPSGTHGVTDDPWTWGPVTSADAAPTGVLSMQPEPWKGLAALVGCLLGWVGLAVAVIAAVKRRPAMTNAAALVPIVALVSVILWPDLPGMIDNLGVSGHLAGDALEVARRVPGSLVLAAAAAFGTAIVAARRSNPAERVLAHTS